MDRKALAKAAQALAPEAWKMAEAMMADHESDPEAGMAMQETLMDKAELAITAYLAAEPLPVGEIVGRLLRPTYVTENGCTHLDQDRLIADHRDAIDFITRLHQLAAGYLVERDAAVEEVARLAAQIKRLRPTGEFSG